MQTVAPKNAFKRSALGLFSAVMAVGMLVTTASAEVSVNTKITNIRKRIKRLENRVAAQVAQPGPRGLTGAQGPQGPAGVSPDATAVARQAATLMQPSVSAVDARVTGLVPQISELHMGLFGTAENPGIRALFFNFANAMQAAGNSQHGRDYESYSRDRFAAGAFPLDFTCAQWFPTYNWPHHSNTLSINVNNGLYRVRVAQEENIPMSGTYYREIDPTTGVALSTRPAGNPAPGSNAQWADRAEAALFYSNGGEWRRFPSGIGGDHGEVITRVSDGQLKFVTICDVAARQTGVTAIQLVTPPQLPVRINGITYHKIGG